MGDIADDMIDDMITQECARGTGHYLDPEQDMEWPKECEGCKKQTCSSCSVMDELRRQT